MNTPNILFVDDETGVLRAMKRLFRRQPVNVLTASSGADGLALLADNKVQVVVSDQRMPGMSGTDFLKAVRQDYPDSVRCILSGYAEMHAVMAAINDGNVYRFIAKPWADEELVSILSDCIELAEANERERQSREALECRAENLERQQTQHAELIELQELLLHSSREVLEHLPIAIAAIDARGRMIYTNRLFASEFGHLPGSMLGQDAGEPWRSAASDSGQNSSTSLVVNDVTHLAHIAKVDIAGQAHALIAMPINAPTQNGIQL